MSSCCRARHRPRPVHSWLGVLRPESVCGTSAAAHARCALVPVSSTKPACKTTVASAVPCYSVPQACAVAVPPHEDSGLCTPGWACSGLSPHVSGQQLHMPAALMCVSAAQSKPALHAQMQLATAAAWCSLAGSQAGARLYISQRQLSLPTLLQWLIGQRVACNRAHQASPCTGEAASSSRLLHLLEASEDEQACMQPLRCLQACMALLAFQQLQWLAAIWLQ